jgi:competence/damage-inducible protein CinA-like protein
MPSAEIITIGTEILLGEIVDTNTRYIARTLRGMGVDLYRTITIGDNVERIAEAIRHSMQRAEIVITTGGLGPTIDDPTREAVARAVGVEMEFREDLWEQVVAIISRYGRKPSENQRRQAYVPKGAIGIPNPVGTAPCFIVETERNAVVSLPGVPNEMEHILHESIIPYLQKRFDLNEIIKIRVLHCAGLGEGMIDEKIADLERLSNPTVGLAAHTGVVDIRIAAKARDEAERMRRSRRSRASSVKGLGTWSSAPTTRSWRRSPSMRWPGAAGSWSASNRDWMDYWHGRFLTHSPSRTCRRRLF